MSTDVLLVDAFNLIRRIYEARPDAGQHMEEVIESCARSLSRALQRHKPSHACVVFDSHDTTWRHLLYPDYKKNRKPTPPALLENLPAFRDAFMQQGVKSLKLESYEADDAIATLAFGVSTNDGTVVILSTDRTFTQLLSPRVRIFNHFEEREVTIPEVEAALDVKVGQLTDYWAMAGDAGNNIKGVPKVGPKTAAGLLARYDSLEGVLAVEDEDPAANRVRQHGDLAQRCKQLVTLKTDVELGINLRSLRM